MKVKLYAGILVLVLVIMIIATYATAGNAAGNVVAENPDSVCIRNGEVTQGPCTAEQNCGQPGCAAPENRPCGCKINTCQIR